MKNTVVMQQEQVIQQKQEAIDEQVRGVSDFKKDNERKQGEIKELQSLSQTLKSKLEESQKSLESNAQMISWLNKQLNEKPGSTSLMAGASHGGHSTSYSANKYSSIGAPKPPTVTGGISS